jgi:rhomboid protease GluP
VTFLVALLLVAIVVYKVTTPEERLPAVRAAIDTLSGINAQRHRALGPFQRALRARTPRALVTPALAAANVAVFVGMMLGAGALNDPTTIVSWGGSFGPRTTNGEWWRLVAAIFVNPGFLQLLINVVALLQVGVVVERLVGRWAFTTTYLASGVLAGVAGLATSPIAVIAGTAGAVFGLYGLLIGCSAWAAFRRTEVAFPAAGIKWFTPPAMIFVLYNVGAAGGVVCFAGLLAGVGFAFVFARDTPERTAPARRAQLAFATALGLVIAAAISLRGITDVEPELQRLTATEHRTADEYRVKSALYAKGSMPARDLADLIERSILPELQAADNQIAALRGVPRDAAWRVDVARQYLQLRLESWQLRINGLRDAGVSLDPTKVPGSKKTFRAWTEERHRARLRSFGKAEGRERESLEVLNRLAGNTVSVRAG